MRIALKVDVDTLRGTLEGVPALLRLFDQFNVRATFLFSLGPDHTGRAIKRVFRPGFLSKVGRTSVTSHYGIKTLLYGTLLPGPHIGKRGAQVMRSVAAAGHETGIHTYDHIYWQDSVSKRDATWTRTQMDKARAVYQEIFQHPAHTHGAAGWQMNSHAFRLEQEYGFRYASDCRGTQPFVPVIDGQTSTCPQLPTTLPTLDEVIGLDGWNEGNVHEYILAQSEVSQPHGHVNTLHAELEGMRLLPTLQKLLQGWRARGANIGTTDDVFNTLDVATLPRLPIVYGEIPGRSGVMALQGI
ncbi:MAG: 4-deoxy-4-formamido-L-arabinose-phosphoundecaprenol deformylase [Gammaproteobacteria bacterium]|nr:4-deoxy-4-formamido-L-arabinose-phosphoundecaprenol deformylase [Gammaproteobacteria bacterium]